MLEPGFPLLRSCRPGRPGPRCARCSTRRATATRSVTVIGGDAERGERVLAVEPGPEWLSPLCAVDPRPAARRRRRRAPRPRRRPTRGPSEGHAHDLGDPMPPIRIQGTDEGLQGRPAGRRPRRPRDPRRRVHGARRAVRLRQVDAAADARGDRRGHRGQRSTSATATSRGWTRASATSRWSSRATRCTRT